jgi:hypothetical protein
MKNTVSVMCIWRSHVPVVQIIFSVKKWCHEAGAVHTFYKIDYNLNKIMTDWMFA